MSNITSYTIQNLLLENQSFRNAVGMKPKSFSTHYQGEIARVSRELRTEHHKATQSQKIGYHRKQGRKIKNR